MTPDTNECWILGVESSCDETALALLRTRADGSELLSERLASQTPLHSRYGGVVPEVAARAHSETLPLLAAEVLAEARQQAKAPERKPDLIAATLGPGLVGGLAAGAVFARALSWAWNARFMAINHLAAHALSPRFAGEVAFPYFLLLVSGGHCQLVAVLSPTHFRVYGETLDDAAGEVFDKVARSLGFPWPGGPHLAQAAESFAEAAGGHKPALAEMEKQKYFGLPRVFLKQTQDSEGNPQFPFSFSGLKTATVRQAQKLQQTSNGQDLRAGLAFAFESRVVEQLVRQSEAALKVFLYQESAALQAKPTPPVLAVAGGVGANHALRRGLADLAAKHGLAFCPPTPSLCSDNAVMIAHLAAERLAQATPSNSNSQEEEQLPVRPRWPLRA